MNNFPTFQEVTAVHKILIDEFGGSHGIRDKAALESALIRPQLGYYEKITEEAAALLESLANNHPFVDGNKRVAFFVTDTFLRMNGYYIECDNEETYVVFMQMFSENNFRFDQLLQWLESKVQKL